MQTNQAIKGGFGMILIQPPINLCPCQGVKNSSGPGYGLRFSSTTEKLSEASSALLRCFVAPEQIAVLPLECHFKSQLEGMNQTNREDGRLSGTYKSTGG